MYGSLIFSLGQILISFFWVYDNQLFVYDNEFLIKEKYSKKQGLPCTMTCYVVKKAQLCRDQNWHTDV